MRSVSVIAPWLLLGQAGCASPLTCREGETQVLDLCVRDAAAAQCEDRVLGAYAFRSTVFARSVVNGMMTMSPGITYGLLRIGAEGTSFVIEQQLCGVESQDAGGGRYKTPSALLARLGQGSTPLTIDCANDTFFTVERDDAIGWQQGLPEGCDEGDPMSTFAWQPDEPCLCPSTVALRDLPQAPNDCRLGDLDADGVPGYTIELSYGVLGVDLAKVRVSQVQRSRGWFKGTISEDRFHRVRWLDTGSAIAALACEPSPCLSSEVLFCPGEVNEMLLIPLDDRKPWNCSELVKAEASLFANSASTPVPTEAQCLRGPSGSASTLARTAQ